MIKTENIIVRGVQAVRTYSDAGYMIQNADGVKYDQAIDPAGSGRVYTETDELVPTMDTGSFDVLNAQIEDKIQAAVTQAVSQAITLTGGAQ